MDETPTVIKIKSNRSGTISKVKWVGLLQCDRSYPVRNPDWVKILIVTSVNRSCVAVMVTQCIITLMGRLLNTKQAAELLGIKRVTVNNYTSRGRLHPTAHSK